MTVIGLGGSTGCIQRFAADIIEEHVHPVRGRCGQLPGKIAQLLFFRALTRKGHSVVVYAPIMGDMVDPLRAQCIACVTDLANVDAGTNYTHWNDPRWFDRWTDIAAAATPEDQRVIIDDQNFRHA